MSATFEGMEDFELRKRKQDQDIEAGGPTLLKECRAEALRLVESELGAQARSGPPVGPAAGQATPGGVQLDVQAQAQAGP